MEAYEKYVGAVFDNRYKIEKIVGIGGMAVVFRAFDMLMKRNVAVKVLREEIASDAESVKRFINESKAVAMLSHPNIVSIYDVSVKDDLKYIVMEYIEGITLKSYMNRKGALSLREIISYTEQVLKALEHAHSKGIVHRDIKPHNILLLKNGTVKVTDFGIAKLPNAETLTMTDKAIGTVYYISPEQASGKPIDSRSDLYSLGVLMYEMATGELPFTADSPVSVALKQVNETALSPRNKNPDIPKGLEHIITTAMEKDPDERYQSAEAMQKQLMKLKENPAIIFKKPQPKKAGGKKEDEKKNFLQLLFGGQPMLPVILGVTLAFLIIAVIAGVVVINKVFQPSGYQDREVPNFVNSFLNSELEAWFEKSEYFTLKTEYQFDDTKESNCVLKQTPAAGTKVSVKANEDKAEIILTVSFDKKETTVPDLYNLDKREVEAKLSQKGLRLKGYEEIYDDTVEPGRIVKTDPASGATTNTNAEITVYVSRGPAEGTIIVPDLTNKPLADAKAKLAELDLILGDVKREKSDKEKGTVLSQSVEKSQQVSAKTTIDLVISFGPYYDEKNNPEGTEPETTTAPVTTPPPDTTTAPVTTPPPETTPASESETTAAAQETSDEQQNNDAKAKDE